MINSGGNIPPPDSDALPVDPVGSTQASVFRVVPWRWYDVLLGLAPFILGYLLPAKIEPQLLPYLPDWTWMVVLGLTLAWMTLYPLLVTRRRLGSLHLAWPRSVAKEVGIAVVVMIPLFALMAGFATLSQHVAGPDAPPSPVQSIAFSPNRANLIALFVLAVVGAPLGEELIFRGLIFNGLRQRWGLGLATLVTGVFFGAYHNEYPLLDQVGIGIGGVMLCLVYAWRQTLLTPMLVHGFVNLAAMVLTSFAAATYAASPILGVMGTADGPGLRITYILPDGPAASAGLQVGDTLTAIDANPTPDQSTLVQIVRSYKPGDKITLTYRHEGQVIQAPTVLRKRSP